MTTYTAAKSTGKYDRVDKMILERTRTINEFVWTIMWKITNLQDIGGSFFNIKF